MSFVRTFVLFCVILVVECCDLEELYFEKTVSLQDSTVRSDVIIKGLALMSSWTSSSDGDEFVAHLKLLTTYKGAAALMATGSSVYRQVNVTLKGGGNYPAGRCLPGQELIPMEYVIFCRVDDRQILYAESIVRWTENREQKVWSALGWDEWSDWSSCSVSCSGGIQQRTRICKRKDNLDCSGYNVEQRHCNLFSCYGTVDPLAVDERAYFHGPRGHWQRVPDRPTAWRLRPDSYIWVPSTQLFPQTQTFPKGFIFFITLRLAEQTRLGTVFSLRSRRRQEAYVSLELAGREGVNLVHASSNGTDIIRIPVGMDDGRWHQIAISVHEDSTIYSYVDCDWLQTDILKKNSFDIPEDSDLIIGYLFEGDLEQMTILTDPDQVSFQCSPNRTPIMDASLDEKHSETTTRKKS